MNGKVAYVVQVICAELYVDPLYLYRCFTKLIFKPLTAGICIYEIRINFRAFDSMGYYSMAGTIIPVDQLTRLTLHLVVVYKGCIMLRMKTTF